MCPRLPLGSKGTFRMAVGEEHSAHVMGNKGVHVLATPVVAGLFERAATAALAPVMLAEEISVGTVINVRHLRPTPVGMDVTATVTLRQVTGNRYLFDAVVFDQVEKAAEGEIERTILKRGRFFLRLEGKKPPRPA